MCNLSVKFQLFVFFLNNHREYIEKSIKLIAKAKNRNMTKKKADLKKIDLLQQKTKKTT
jgi:hypothetical protein